jgi:tetratricopeptide (TPR) repeat protein
VAVVTLACVGFYLAGSMSQRREREAQERARAELVAKGDAALLGADFAAAERALAQLGQSGGNGAALARRALLLELQGNYPGALAQAEQALKEAGAGGLDAALAQALRADALANAGKYDEALEAAREAQKLEAGLGLAYAVEANALAHQASDRSEQTVADEAIELLDAARDNLRDDAPLLKALAHSLIGDTLLAAHDVSGDDAQLDEAGEAYKSALDISDQPLFHVGLGYAELARDEYGAARDAFNGALDRHDDYALAHVGLGWVDYADPDASYEQSLAAVDEALALDGDNGWAHYARGRVLFDQDNYDDALAAFEQAGELLPDNAEIVSWQGRSQQRRGFNSDDDDVRDEAYAQAATLLRRAIELNDRHKVALSQLGWTLQYQDEYDDSLEYFEQAIAIDPEQDEAFNGMGWSLYNLDKFAEAEQNFREAVRLSPSYENAFYGLGQALEKLDRIEDAKQAYRDALAANPDYTIAQEALNRLE